MECFTFIKSKRRTPESEDSLENQGTNPTDDPLHYIVTGLLRYFNGFKCLHNAKKNIKKTCDINEEDWPFEKIKQAWERAQTMGKSDQEHWAFMIMLQVMKYMNNERQRRGADSGRQDSTFYGADESDYTDESDDADEGEDADVSDDSTSTVCSHTPETVYIGIPLSQLFHNKSVDVKADPDALNIPKKSDYKLIDRSPSYTDDADEPEKPSEDKLQKEEEDGTRKIPLSQLFDNELSTDDDPINSNLDSKKHKFIHRNPSDTYTVRNKNTYVLAYDDASKNAKWVYEILNKDTLAKNKPGTIHFGKCMKTEGYERGHLAAAANHKWCQDAYNSTFVFSNISPQVEIINRRCWNILENYCRSKIRKDKKNVISNVHVYTGPVNEDGSDSGGKTEDYVTIKDDKGIKKKKEQRKMIEKKVPTAFFKVIIVENDDGTVRKPKCFLIPNNKEDRRIVDYENLMKSIKESKEEKSRSGQKGISIKGKKKPQNLEEEKKKFKFIKENFRESLEEIERRSGLKFTDETFKEGRKDSIKTVTWTGEDGNGQMCDAKIQVRICNPLSDVEHDPMTLRHSAEFDQDLFV